MKSLITIIIIYFCMFSSVILNAQEKSVIPNLPETFQTPTTATEQPKLNLVEVIAFDLNANGHLSEEDIKNGSNGVLVLFNPSKPGEKPTTDNVYIINNHNALSKLDEDKNGIIDAHDQAYNFLYLMIYYQGGNKIKLFPISQIGIRAIFLKPEHMQKDELNRLGKGFMKNVGMAIMSDGSKRQYHPVFVKPELIRRK